MIRTLFRKQIKPNLTSLLILVYCLFMFSFTSSTTHQQQQIFNFYSDAAIKQNRQKCVQSPLYGSRIMSQENKYKFPDAVCRAGSASVTIGLFLGNAANKM